MLLIKYTIYLIFLKILHFILFAIFCKNCYCSKSCIKFPYLLFLKYELYESTWLREFSPNILYMPYISLIIQKKKQKHLFFYFLITHIFCPKSFQIFFILYIWFSKIHFKYFKIYFRRIFYLQRHLYNNIFKSLFSNTYKG